MRSLHYVMSLYSGLQTNLTEQPRYHRVKFKTSIWCYSNILSIRSVLGSKKPNFGSRKLESLR